MSILQKNISSSIKMIISGGQTGADRGALDAAISAGVDHGGYCPAGRRSEDGCIPDRYDLIETSSSGYEERTRRNVAMADVTLIITSGEMTPGSKLTLAIVETMDKPHINIDLTADDLKGGRGLKTIINVVRSYIIVKSENISRPIIINVAGSRESKCPGIQKTTELIMFNVIKGFVLKMDET